MASKPKSVKGNGRVTAKPPTSNPSPKAKKTAKKKKTTPAHPAPKGAQHFIRNLHSGAGGARLDLASGRIHLEARGRRGDMRLVNEEQIEDPAYQYNLDLLFEEVPIEVGQEIIRKQAINKQSDGPTTMELLTNKYGEAYADKHVTIEPSFESQGVTVASIDDAGAGRYTDSNVEINRAPQPTDFFGAREAAAQPRQALGPQQVQVPGSQPVFNPDILPGGLNTEQATIFIQTPREQRLALVEAWRQQAMEGADYRQGLNVETNPVEVEE